MSLIASVAQMADERGAVTLDEAAAWHPGYTRTQVRIALNKAVHLGRLTRRGDQYIPGAWAPKKAPMRRVASVWELGQL